MSKWSSFEDSQRHANAWRKYIQEGANSEANLNEGILDRAKTAIRKTGRELSRKAGGEVGSVTSNLAGKQADPAEPDAEFAGINSDVYPDSLKNILKARVSDGTITDEQMEQIVLKMIALTREEGVVLEALGDEPNPRSYSSEATDQLRQLIDSFGLEPGAIKKLNQTINKWAKMNTVKFEPSATPALPADSGAAEADADPDKEPGTVRRAIAAAKKAANSEAGKMVEAALDGLSLIPGANIPASIGNAILNVIQGEPAEAGMALLSLIPVAGAAGKLGKFGPLAAKLAPTIKTLSKTKAIKSGKEGLQAALDKAGVDANVEEITQATQTAVEMYDKLARIPGVGEELSKHVGAYIDPLRSLMTDLPVTGIPPSDSAADDVEPIDLSDEVELLRRSQDPRDPPFPPPEGYNIREFSGIPAVFISMVNNRGGEILNGASREGEYKIYDFTDGWGLYATTTSGEPRNVVYNPKLSDLDGTQGVGIWLPDWMNAADFTDLPIRESLLERWQVLAGINKRVL